MAYIRSAELESRVLAGDTRAIARLLSRAESGIAEARQTLDAMFAHAGRAHVVGITGVPGSGKSTLVAKLAAEVRKSGRTVAVVAVDPSSPFSGGAILGDRIRMGDLAGDAGIFVRSMATRGALGGLAKGTLEAVDVLDAAGFALVMIETVGVGQDEVEIARAAHTTVVVSAPGLGDDIQAIKAGILEIADIHAVSKSDKPEAAATVSALRGMMALGSERMGSRWAPPVLAVSAVSGERVNELKDAISRHWAHLGESGELAGRQRGICRMRILGAAKHLFQRKFDERADEIGAHVQAVVDRDMDPSGAAYLLLGWTDEVQAT